jgi:hypothetical protein
MRPALAAIGLLFVSVIIATADEPRVPPVEDSALNRYLLERIAQLERRVAELEAKLARPYTPAPQTYAPGQPHRDVPSAPYDASRLPYGPTFPTPRNGEAIPHTPSGRVPDNWRRYEFNGQYVYLIPAGNWQPGTTQRRSPLQLPAETFPSNSDQRVRVGEDR